MDDIDRIVEKEEDLLYQMLRDGDINDSEYEAEMKRLHEGAQAELESRARAAYETVMSGW